MSDDNIIKFPTKKCKDHFDEYYEKNKAKFFGMPISLVAENAYATGMNKAYKDVLAAQDRAVNTKEEYNEKLQEISALNEKLKLLEKELEIDCPNCNSKISISLKESK